MRYRYLLAPLLLIYPLIVFFGTDMIGSHAVAIVLLVLLALRALSGDEFIQQLFPALILPSAALSLLSFWNASALWFIPVGISFSLMANFLLSAARPPTVIEQFARKMEPQLPPEAIRYCFGVTLVWATFFLFNGLFSGYTAMYSSPETWTLYNGGISYVLIGILFSLEYIYRQRYRKSVREATQSL